MSTIIRLRFFNYFSLAIERGLQCTTNAIFVSHMQKLWVLKVLLVHDPKPPGEPDINVEGILKIKSVLIVEHFDRFFWVGWWFNRAQPYTILKTSLKQQVLQ